MPEGSRPKNDSSPDRAFKALASARAIHGEFFDGDRERVEIDSLVAAHRRALFVQDWPEAARLLHEIRLRFVYAEVTCKLWEKGFEAATRGDFEYAEDVAETLVGNSVLAFERRLELDEGGAV